MFSAPPFLQPHYCHHPNPRSVKWDPGLLPELGRKKKKKRKRKQQKPYFLLNHYLLTREHCRLEGLGGCTCGFIKTKMSPVSVSLSWEPVTLQLIRDTDMSCKACAEQIWKTCLFPGSTCRHLSTFFKYSTKSFSAYTVPEPNPCLFVSSMHIITMLAIQMN